MGQAISGGSRNVDGQTDPPLGYITPNFPSLYPPNALGEFPNPDTKGYFLYFAEDIWHFTLYWHIILHVLMFGLTGIWFTIVALLSPSSSVSLRTPSDRRGRTDFRTNTEVAEEGRSRALESELSGGRGFGRKKKREPRGSISDNAAAKERARMRAKSGSSSRSAEARKLSVGSDPGAHVKSTHGRSSNQSHGHHNSFQDRGQGGRKGSDEMDVKVMDFAQSEDDIPLQTRNTSTPRLYQNRGDPEETVQPVPTRRTSFSRVLRPTPGQGRDDHPDITPGPSSPGSVKSRRKGKEPMDSPSPPRMSSPSREQDAEARQRGPRHRPSSRNQSRFSNPFRSSSSNTAEDDPDNLRPFQSLHSTTQATKTYGRHQRRPAPIWLSFLPLPFFLLWGVTTALIMSTIIGFTLSAVYNTVGFEMSTWIPFLWSLAEASLVLISSYSTFTAVL